MTRIICTRCDGTGFLNIDQIPEKIITSCKEDWLAVILEWMLVNSDHDVSVCDCCGNAIDWYGYPGEHYHADDPQGDDGPYAYNGGLCECN